MPGPLSMDYAPQRLFSPSLWQKQEPGEGGGWSMASEVYGLMHNFPCAIQNQSCCNDGIASVPVYHTVDHIHHNFNYIERQLPSWAVGALCVRPPAITWLLPTYASQKGDEHHIVLLQKS